MSSLLLLSGPNLNLLGDRQPLVYGAATLDEYVAVARETAEAAGLTLEHLQSNHEGVLIDKVHEARDRHAAIVLNGGALTHTSHALADALRAYEGVKVEVHISNPYAREEFRRTSVTAPAVDAVITGCGLLGYRFAVEAAVDHLRRREQARPEAGA